MLKKKKNKRITIILCCKFECIKIQNEDITFFGKLKDLISDNPDFLGLRLSIFRTFSIKPSSVIIIFLIDNHLCGIYEQSQIIIGLLSS